MKRVCAFILAVLMAFGGLPLSAFAVGAEPDVTLVEEPLAQRHNIGKRKTGKVQE